MATMKKHPALIQKALLPKILDNHGCVGLINGYAKFEDTSLLRDGRNRLL